MEKLPELVPVMAGNIDGQPVSLVSAKRLHSFLCVGRDFTTWIKGRISQYGFTAGVDFTVVEKLSAPVSGSAKYRQQIAHDYLITIDMGKELAMVERNEKGRQIRRYFIECEKKLREDTTRTQSPLNVDIIMRVRNGSVTHIEHHKSGSVITTEWAIHLLRKSGWIVMPRDELLNMPLAQLMPENLSQTGTCVR